MKKNRIINKGISNTSISSILDINMSTLGYWKNSLDFRNKLFQILKSFSVENLKRISLSNDIFKNGRTIYFSNSKTSFFEYKCGDVINSENELLTLLISNNCCIAIKEFLKEDNKMSYENINLPNKYNDDDFIIIKYFSIILTTESL